MAFNNQWNAFWKNRWWTLNGTYYFDPINGDDSNNGTSPSTPWASQSKAEDLVLSAGQSIYRKVDGEWIPFRIYSATPAGKYVHGYYQGVYAAAPNTNPLPVSSIQWGALTHVAHDHVRPVADGSLDYGTYTIDEDASSALITAAHENGVRCTCVIADVSYSPNTPDYVAATENNLATLIDNILDLLIVRGYDGIDIDWETGGTYSRVRNFMTSLYPAVKAQNPNFTISMANGSGSLSGADGSYSWVPVVDFSDFWTVMCYGSYLIGGFYTWFNDPLFDGNVYTTSGRLEFSTNHTVNSFLKLGVPPVHMMHGLPFYGGGLTGDVSPVGLSGSGPTSARQYYTQYDIPSGSYNNQLYLPYNIMQGTFSLPSYIDGVQGDPLFPDGITWTIQASGMHWDDTTLCPWIHAGAAAPSGNAYVTYEDPGSLTAKAQYGLAKDLLGASIWEISGDYIPGRTNNKTPLLTALGNALPKIAFPTITPDVPVSLSIADVGTGSITVHWPTIDNARKYNIKRSTTSGSGYSTLATLNAPNYVDSSVSSGTTYYYVVSSISSDGTESSNSTEVSVTATVIPAVTNLLTSPTDLTNGTAWSLTGDGAAATNATTLQTSTGETDLSQFVTGLNPATDYIATVVLTLTSAAGFGSFVIFDPSFATTLGIQNQALILDVPITFTVAFNTGSNYNVFFEVIFPQQTTPAVATIQITNLYLVAKNGTFLPPVPVNVTNSVMSINVYNHYGVQLNWAWMAGATQYIIRRSVATSGKRYTTIGLTTSNSYFDTTPYPNGNYYYLISSMNGNWEGPPTSEITVSTPADYAPPNVLISPNDLTNAAWVYPTGSAALSASTVQCCALTDASKGDTFFDQNRVPIIANGNYIAMMTVSAPVDCFVSLFISDTNNIQIAKANRWILAGTLNNWRLSFSTFADIFQTTPFISVGIDFDNHAAGQTVTVTNLNVAMDMPQVQTNIIQAPTDLTNVAWTVSNATMTAPLTMVCGSSVDANNTCGAIAQQPIAVDPNTDYVVTITIYRTDSDPSQPAGEGLRPYEDYADYMALTVYGQGFSSQLGSNVGSLINEGPTDLYAIFNSGANQNVIFGCATAPGAGTNLTGKTLVFSNIAMKHNPYANADTVLLPRILSVSFESTSLVANQAVTGTLTINRPAPAGGTQVALSSSTALTLPAAVTIPEASTSVTFAAIASAVDRAVTAIVLADYNSVHVTTKLFISPGLSLANLKFSPVAIKGGDTSTGTVLLSETTSSDFVVNLSSNSSAATVPATVTVTAGNSSATFTLTSNAVSSLQAVTITATNGGVTITAGISLAISSNLVSISVDPATVVGGLIGSSTSTGTVQLAASTPQSISVILVNTNPSVTVPSSVIIPQGAASATFSISSIAVTSTQIAILTANYAGVSVNCQLNVVPSVNLASLTISPNPIIGGNTAIATVTLTASAPVGGITVAILSSSYVYAGMPASVGVAAGAISANFNITTQVVTAPQTATVTVSYQSSSKALPITMNPTASLTLLTTAASFVMNGGTTTGTVTLAAVAPTGGSSVALSSDNSNMTVPSSVTVSAGNRTATFTITAASSVAADVAVNITATLNTAQTIAVDLLSSANQATLIYAGMSGSSEGQPEGWPYDYQPTNPSDLGDSQWNTPPTYGSNWHALTVWGVLYLGRGPTAKSATNTRVNIRAVQSWWFDTSVNLWKRIQYTNSPDGEAYYEDFRDDTSLTADVRTESDGTISATAGIGTNSSGQSLAGRNYHFYPTARGLFTYANYGGMFSMVQVRLILGNPSLVDDRAKSQYVISVGADYWPDATSGLPSGYDPEGDGANPGIGNSKYIIVNNNWRTICMTTKTQAFLATNAPPIDLTGISL